MKEIVVIGTIHGHSTPESELVETLASLHPVQLFVELSHEEVHDRPREESIRDEMFAAYDWAHVHDIPCVLFDIEDDILKDGVTGKEPEFMEHELKSKELLKGYSWKELNRTEPWADPEVAELEKKIVDMYFDTDRSKQREHKMLENIRPKLIEGTNVIVTGAGHLTFFKEHFPEAHLPFRE